MTDQQVSHTEDQGIQTLLDNIIAQYDNWRSKGMMATTLKVGPDIRQRLINHFGALPSTIHNMKVLPWNEPGFFCTGPWHFQ